MNKVTNSRLLMILGSLTCAFFSVTVESQLAEEKSVPEPTQLHSVATAADSELIWSEALGDIRSDDANAEISAIEVEIPNSGQVRGVKIALENAMTSDHIYIPESLLSSFRDELQELENTRQYYGECQAQYRCVHGIARCRPSTTEKQAYCPGRYSTPDSEGGLVLSTPRNTFSFPSVDASQLDALIGEAIQVLE